MSLSDELRYLRAFKGGGNLGESGSVAWIFDHKGVISVRADDADAEELELKAIDAGAGRVDLRLDLDACGW